MKAYVYIRNADGTFSAFEDIQSASQELGRSLRLRWASALRARMAVAPQADDIIDARRQSAKGK